MIKPLTLKITFKQKLTHQQITANFFQPISSLYLKLYSISDDSTKEKNSSQRANL